VGRFADRLFASPDLYAASGHQAEQSINFVTCHDGFTLADLVSYQQKRNQQNGEENRDGNDDNRAWNCGVEGPTDDPAVLSLRARQIRNFLTVNLLSAGVPMLTMGDEMGRSQGGNNNAYCQDNEVSWLDWTLAQKNAALLRFARKSVGLRVAFDPAEPAKEVTLAEFLVRSKVEWHGVRLGSPDWSEGSRSLAVGFSALDGSVRLHCIFNAWKEALQFELPASEEGWRLLIDTALPPPDDARGWDEALPVEGRHYLAQAHSVVMLGTG